MIRKNKNAIRPLYREIVPASLESAWRDRWLWPFAIVASLLHTGGIYDTILMTMRQVRTFGGQIMATGLPTPFEQAYLSITGGAGILPAFGAIQSILYALIFIVTILAISLISQGALAYGIGGRLRGRVPSFRECLTVGARSIGKLFVLNVITLGLIWLGKLFMLLPWSSAAEGSSALTVTLFVLASLVYMVLVVALTAVHFFALYAMIVDKAHIAESLETGLVMLKRNWLAILELALILFVFGAIVLAGMFLTFVVMGIPVILLIAAAALLGQSWLVSLGWLIASLLFTLIVLSAGAFCVTFQFNAWYRLGVRSGEGKVLAKIHRWIHAALYGR